MLFTFLFLMKPVFLGFLLPLPVSLPFLTEYLKLCPLNFQGLLRLRTHRRTGKPFPYLTFDSFSILLILFGATTTP